MIREPSHITSASEGGGGLQMLTDADRGEGGGLGFADVSINFCKIALPIAFSSSINHYKLIFLVFKFNTANLLAG